MQGMARWVDDLGWGETGYWENMYSLFRLLFSKSYWRTLFHPETWRQSGVSVRRLHKDKRARKQLWQVFRLLIAPLLCLLYVVWLCANLLAAVVAIPVLIFVIMRKWHRQQSAPIREAPSVVPPNMYVPKPKVAHPATPELRREFAEMALVAAVLVDRAGSEDFLKTKVLPEGFEVVTRQRHMEVLREYGLYERLGPAERDLMLLPDGHWEWESIHEVSMQLEPLRLLRWVLQVDGFLPTVGATMAADYRLAGTVVKDPALLFAGEKMVSVDSVRTGIEAADHYFFRCWAEGLRRGLYSAEDEQEAERAKAYAERMHGKEAEDMLLGTVIVSKAEDADVRLGASLAQRRYKVLGWVKGRMYGEVGPVDSLTQIG